MNDFISISWDHWKFITSSVGLLIKNIFCEMFHGVVYENSQLTCLSLNLFWEDDFFVAK